MDVCRKCREGTPPRTGSQPGGRRGCSAAGEPARLQLAQQAQAAAAAPAAGRRHQQQRQPGLPDAQLIPQQGQLWQGPGKLPYTKGGYSAHCNASGGVHGHFVVHVQGFMLDPDILLALSRHALLRLLRRGEHPRSPPRSVPPRSASTTGWQTSARSLTPHPSAIPHCICLSHGQPVMMCLPPLALQSVAGSTAKE